MIRDILIDEYIPESILKDVIKTIAFLREKKGKVKLCRIPHEDLAPIFDKISGKMPMMPFRPLLCGIPVDFGVKDHIEVIAVHDDDTNVSQNLKHESEVLWQQ